MRSFTQWLESWDDDSEEGASIDGEYWITPDGYTMYADGDVNDMNHEGYVIDHLQRGIAEQLGVQIHDEVDWDDVVHEASQSFYREQRQQAESEGNQALVQELDELWDDDKESFFHQAVEHHGIGDQALQIAMGFGDARMYGIKDLGWKRVAGHNIETWTFTPHDIKAIIRGLEDIVPELQDPSQLEVYIYVYSNNQSYDLTIEQLEQMIGEQPKPTVTPDLKQVPSQPAAPPTPPSVPSMGQVARDRHTADIDLSGQAGNNHQVDQDLKTMNPYYAKKKFPFADWTFHKFGRLL